MHWIQIMADLWFWKNTLQCWAKYSWALSKDCGIKWAVHTAAAAKIFRTWVHGTEQCCSTPWPSSSEGTGGSSDESHQLMLMEVDCFAVPLVLELVLVPLVCAVLVSEFPWRWFECPRSTALPWVKGTQSSHWSCFYVKSACHFDEWFQSHGDFISIKHLRKFYCWVIPGQ